MVVRTIGSHQGLSQRRPEMILKENLFSWPGLCPKNLKTILKVCTDVEPENL